MPDTGVNISGPFLGGMQFGANIAQNRRDSRLNEARVAMALREREEARRLREAELLAQLSVDPVMSAGGGVNFPASFVADRLNKQTGQLATAMGMSRAMNQEEGPITAEEAALARRPEYQIGFNKSLAERAEMELRDRLLMERSALRDAAILGQIEARQKAWEEQFRKKDEVANRPPVAIPITDIDGNVIPNWAKMPPQARRLSGSGLSDLLERAFAPQRGGLTNAPTATPATGKQRFQYDKTGKRVPVTP